jgi:hypothetical protein
MADANGGRPTGGTAPHEPSATSQVTRTLSVRQAAFIGVGSMVGAGNFALLGAAGEVAGAAVWISFLLAGPAEPSTGSAATASAVPPESMTPATAVALVGILVLSVLLDLLWKGRNASTHGPAHQQPAGS